MVFCTNCGKELLDGAKFCSHCGTPVSNINKESREERKIAFDGEVHKCPHCGWELKSFETVCSNPDCGLEIRGSKSSRTVNDFAKKLEQATTEKQRILAIKTFPIPNTKEDIYELFLQACSNFDDSYYASHLDIEDESDAWFSLIERCYRKAQVAFKDIADIKYIEERYNDINEKVRKKILKFRWSKIFKKYGAWIATGFVIFLFIFILIISVNVKIEIGFLEKDFIGKSPTYVESYLEEKGFRNIELQDIYESALQVEDGAVVDVKIAGDDSYENTDKFKKDVKIIIIRYKKPKNIGGDLETLLGRDCIEVASELYEKGFLNITFNEVESWDSNDKMGELKNITINGGNTFEKDDLIPLNARIILTYCICPITVIKDADDFKKKDYWDVMDALEEMGFTHIDGAEIEISFFDGLFQEEYSVKYVSINGKKDFKVGDKFMPNVKVEIGYYVKKN